MEDGSKQPNAFGGGQQRSHPRPFFYVQPPSQPYFLYQHWQMNNPYSHYGLPGGFNFGRPPVHPYMYMQYPFVYPPGPVYPVDHRRGFEPRHHAPGWGDSPRRQHSPQPCRETACSEAQTDPSDAVNKLIECLDKIRELDSGVASHASGMFSPAEEKKSEEEGEALPSGPAEGRSGSSSAVCGDSTVAYDAESSLGWSGALEEDPPLDSSSVHEGVPESPSGTDASVSKELLGAAGGGGGDYQILRLPVESVLMAEAPPLLYPPLRSTQERMSVLSPSLDELSSREEMFSTDLDDGDLYPRRVYAGRRLLGVVSRSGGGAEEVEEVWLRGGGRYVCACCGRNLSKAACHGTGRGARWDEGGDSDEDGGGRETPVRVVIRKHAAPRKPHPAPPRHTAKRSQYKEDPGTPEEGPALTPEAPGGGTEGDDEPQRGTCLDRLCREGQATPESGRWGDEVVPRRRQPPQRQETSALRKVVYQRPRDEEEEQLHWDRGSARRGDSRC